jgi:hypothetical protein
MMGTLAGLMDNLVLEATTNRTTVQQLTSENLLLTTSVATLMVANKKLTKMVAHYYPMPQGCSGGQWCPSWPQTNLGQLLLDAWVQGIAYQQNLQCDWQ